MVGHTHAAADLDACDLGRYVNDGNPQANSDGRAGGE